MISVNGSRQLQAVALAMKAASRDLRLKIYAATRDTMNPVWKQTVSQYAAGAPSPAGTVINSGVRIAAGNPPTAKAAQSRRGIGRSRRLIPAENWAWFEFGSANRERVSSYQRRNRRRGGTHQVKRRASRGLPAFRKSGRVAYPAFAEVAPRMVSLWVQLVVRKYYDAVEGKG